MRVEWFTAGMQVVILILIGTITFRIWHSTKLTKKTNELIGQYRREVEWLSARIETLEARTGGQKNEVGNGGRPYPSQRGRPA